MKVVSTLVSMFLVAGALSGCGGNKAETAKETAQAPPAANVLELTAVDQTFQGPTTIASGWVTFRFKNDSEMTHFALVERLPDGKSVADQQREVAPVFQEGLDLLNAGKPDEAMQKFGELPEWFQQITFWGGPGFLGPGHTVETTVHLDPGNYMLECYVKTVGVFHSYNPDTTQFGMVHALEVTGTSTAPEPEADLNLTISSDQGIQIDKDPTPGKHTVAVHFKDQKAHENFVGHDVHLVRLAADTKLDELATWMDWTQPTGLEVPAPAEFLGGVNEMPAGSIGYFTVDLTPGQYAWIAEVPHPQEKGMLKSFTVLGD